MRTLFIIAVIGMLAASGMAAHVFFGSMDADRRDQELAQYQSRIDALRPAAAGGDIKAQVEIAGLYRSGEDCVWWTPMDERVHGPSTNIPGCRITEHSIGYLGSTTAYIMYIAVSLYNWIRTSFLYLVNSTVDYSLFHDRRDIVSIWIICSSRTPLLSTHDPTGTSLYIR